MTYTLKTDEILEALQISSHPLADSFMRRLESLTNEMAYALAESQNIEKGLASFEGTGFAGTACTFRPTYEGQPLPECMADYDAAEEWEFIKDEE